MRFIFALFVALIVTSALAQQPLTPSQMAIQIDAAVNGMAQAIEQRDAAIVQLQAKVKELEDKYEKKPEQKK